MELGCQDSRFTICRLGRFMIVLLRKQREKGVPEMSVLREAMKGDFWTRQIPGVGEETGKKLVYAMYRAGIIDDTFEAYKETDREYYLAKCVRLREENED